MLLSEMVRKLADEAVIKSYDPNVAIAAVHDWTTRVTEQITLTKESLVYVKFTGYAETGAGGNVRVLCNGSPVLATGDMNDKVGFTRDIILLLPSGTHTFEFQTSQYRCDTGFALRSLRIQLIHIALLGFADKARDSTSTTATASAGTTTTVINKTIAIPSGRKTCIGSIKSYTAFIYVYMHGEDNRVSVVKNPGEANDSGLLNWRIQVNGMDMSWKDRRNDYNASYSTMNPSYAEGAYGFLATTIPAGGTMNIKINVYNGLASSQSVFASLYVVLCPWFLADTDYEPVNLSFPQGSTLYVVMEPLTSNPTKTLKLGKPRFVSFGSATDYYSTVSGTDIVSWSYTFESVEVSACLLLFAGFGGCISIIAVDVR